jgi:hypothetical protein
MRLRVMLVAALPVLSIAQTQTDCGVMTASQSNTGMPGCGVAPSGYQIQWDWNIKVTNVQTGNVTARASTTSTGTGWCGSLGVHCWDNYPNVFGGTATPYIFAIITEDRTRVPGTWYFRGKVTQTPPGGNIYGVGCAAAQTVYSPPNPVTLVSCACPYGNGSPIIIDTRGEGFHLTDVEHGVLFRERPDTDPLHFAWTDPNFHNGWLALPHDGVVRALSDLFGNFTPQPPSRDPNGYLALAVYDSNHDGVIDAQDPIYTGLRIWIDSNHDGVSQPEELHRLAELRVDSISLHYGELRMTDEYGNQFRYTAAADIDNAGRQDDRSYDVFLVTKQ